MDKSKSLLHATLAGLALWLVGVGTVSASVINISLNPTDWELDPYWTGQGKQAANQTKTSTAEGLQVTTNDLRGPSGGNGAFVRTVGSYNVQNATIRYKWKAINATSFANYWNGHDAWTFGAQMTTHHSWAGSNVIPLDTWIYAEAYVGTDLSYYYNFSYSGYSNSGGFWSAAGVTTSQTWVDSLASVHLKASVNDNYNSGAGFVISEMSLSTPDAGQGQIPEPATALLLCSGLIGLAGTRVRRKNK